MKHIKNTRINSMQKQIQTLSSMKVSLENQLTHKENFLQNSLQSFVGGAFGASSDLTSFMPLAYNNVYAPLTINYQTLMYAYKSQSILQNAIDMPVQDALRGGLDWRSDELDKDDFKALDDYIEDTNFYLTMKTLEEWARLFGGAALLVNTDQDPSKPLSFSELPGKRIKFYAASRWELQATNRWAEYYDFYGQRFHKSRVMTVSGKEAPFQIRWVLQDWGLSELEKILEPFNIYLRTQQAIYDLLKEAKIDVFQFEGFLSQLSSSAGTSRALQRIQIMNQAKNTGNAIVMDMKDKYEQKQVTFSGLAEVWKENRISLASALRIPMTKLFGLSAAGFSSGEDDIENYNAMVESEVREHLKPTLRNVLKLICISLYGDKFDFGFDFKPLRVMSTVDEETVKTSKHNRYMSLASSGYLTPQEFMQLEQKEKLIPIDSEVARGAMPEPLFSGNEEEGGEEDAEEKGPGTKKQHKGKEG